jgi:hypothetical protein
MSTATLLKTKQKTVPLDKYSGKWVAFIDNRVIAWANTLKELALKIKKMALKKKPVYFLVPRKDEGPYIL